MDTDEPVECDKLQEWLFAAFKDRYAAEYEPMMVMLQHIMTGMPQLDAKHSRFGQPEWSA